MPMPMNPSFMSAQVGQFALHGESSEDLSVSQHAQNFNACMDAACDAFRAKAVELDYDEQRANIQTLPLVTMTLVD
jgi:hypothetical protein